MLKKFSPILAIPIFFIALSCRERTATTGTDTVSTDASITTAPTDTTPTISPPASQHEIDHYKFWKVKSVPFARAVKLKGQFDEKGAWEARVRSIEYLGNPVEKNGERILKPEWHLVAYALDVITVQPVRTVTIENQFHRGEKLTIADPAWLLLPASKTIDGKTPPEPPKETDHYVCYKVAEGPPYDPSVKLMDQFDKKRGKTEEVKGLRPALFCVPVSKDGGQIFKPKEHLTIYSFDPRDPFQIVAMTWDQFGRQQLSVEHSEFLGVPTTKLEWAAK